MIYAKRVYKDGYERFYEILNKSLYQKIENELKTRPDVITFVKISKREYKNYDKKLKKILETKIFATVVWKNGKKSVWGCNNLEGWSILENDSMVERYEKISKRKYNRLWKQIFERGNSPNKYF